MQQSSIIAGTPQEPDVPGHGFGRRHERCIRGHVSVVRHEASRQEVARREDRSASYWSGGASEGHRNQQASMMDQLWEELRRQRKVVSDFLGTVRAGDKDYLPQLAAALRVLLLDADYPVLLDAAKSLNMDLRIWGPEAEDRPGVIFAFLAFACSWDRPLDTEAFQYFLTEYLVMPIGNSGGQPYSMAQLIKWTSNKEGGAHFDPKKPRTYLGARQDLEIHYAPGGVGPRRRVGSVDQATRALCQMADYVLHAADHLLAVRATWDRS